jgi:glycosyltransferase involved in cell wall biosynthesis
MKTTTQKSDLIVFSMTRWDSTFTRTSQIMSAFSRYRKVYFFEAPIFGVSKAPIYLLRETRDDVLVVEPYLPEDMSVFDQKKALSDILIKLISDESIHDYTIWSDTPKVIPLIRDMVPKALIYDCIADYSIESPELEKEMFNRADVVLTSSHALYAAKHSLHTNIHNNPDCIDYRHFYQARIADDEPEDMINIPHPRIGFAGDIDGNIDLELIKNLAEQRPEWNFILAGTIKDIDPETLPMLPNIHYLSSKSYVKIPLYISAWDCTFLPYKVNEASRFINPVLISESLVGGCPVVAAPLLDVVTNYADREIILMAEFPLDYMNRIAYAMSNQRNSREWLEHVDKSFRGMSWEKNCTRIAELEHDVCTTKIKQTFEFSLKELFSKTFHAKVPKGNWAQGLNLRKTHRHSYIAF